MTFRSPLALPTSARLMSIRSPSAGCPSARYSPEAAHVRRRLGVRDRLVDLSAPLDPASTQQVTRRTGSRRDGREPAAMRVESIMPGSRSCRARRSCFRRRGCSPRPPQCARRNRHSRTASTCGGSRTPRPLMTSSYARLPARSEYEPKHSRRCRANDCRRSSWSPPGLPSEKRWRPSCRKNRLHTTVFVAVAGRFGLLLFDLPSAAVAGKSGLITTGTAPEDSRLHRIDVVELFELEPVVEMMDNRALLPTVDADQPPTSPSPTSTIGCPWARPSPGPRPRAAEGVSRANVAEPRHARNTATGRSPSPRSRRRSTALIAAATLP